MPASASVCAIIPTYNRASMLRECIDSILGQSRPVQELIVVNDGSDDDTEAVVESYGSHVTFISKENGGKASALNVGLRHCTSDYVWICDDDDVAAPDGLEHLAAALDTNESAGFVFGTFKIFRDGGSGRSFMPPTYWMRHGEPNVHIQFLEEMFTFQYAMLVRRSLYAKVGPFREDLLRSQDHEMAIRLSRNARSVYVPHVIFFQRIHPGQRGTSTDPIPNAANARRWLEYEQRIITPIRAEYDLAEFTPTYARYWEPARAKRAALIERACLCAKCALWTEAIDDFRQASELTPAPVTPDEQRAAEAIVRKLLPWDFLGDNPGWISNLRAIHEVGENGRSIIHSVCRPLVWQSWALFKRGNIRGSARRLSILASILGVGGAISRLRTSQLLSKVSLHTLSPPANGTCDRYSEPGLNVFPNAGQTKSLGTARIDVLIPVYNGVRTVRESLASIQSQTVRNIRIVVINDGSTDGTADIVSSLARDDNRIFLFTKPNGGIVETLNFGLKYCDAEFIARFDADDISYPYRLEAQLAYLRDHPDCLAVSGRVDHIDENGKALHGLPLPGQADLSDPCWSPAREPYLIHPFLMMRRSAITSVGGYRYLLNSEDTDLYWRLAEHGRLHNLEVSLGQYRMHTTSISGASIRNGRVMATNSQRAALSAVRRLRGRPDLNFAQYFGTASGADTLEEIYQFACSDLDNEERIHLSIAASAKLLELTNYRPYELEYSDCAFIRRSLCEMHKVSKGNQAELNWLVTVAAARLLTKGQVAEAAALVPFGSYPVVAARTLRALLRI
jgi:glycosyltransferase involved in cell wall biosynthesis